ncbi:hypothetical protein DFH11DRAFT_1768810 [Phellopilus nigrolimitatus]|nr:hypothetical protein DFH11DRAFT_1768810 [Phellopilus nigrolimitatus]
MAARRGAANRPVPLYKAFGAASADCFLYWAILSATHHANDPSMPFTNRGTRPPTGRLHVFISVLTALSMNHEVAALVESEEEHAVVKTSLVVDELAGTSSVHGAMLRPKASAREKLVEENDRNWLEFLAVLDATFARTRRGTYAVYSASLRFESQDGLICLIKLYFERFGDKACCFEDLKPYAVLEGSELSASTRNSMRTRKLRRHVLGAEELSAPQETEHALVYLRAYTAAGAVRSGKYSQQLLSRVIMKMLYM